MNKEVIYIEPDDDITDIVTKIKSAKERIVALVPSKRAEVFRSIVNIKLIRKASIDAEKQVVIITTDPSIVKLAAAARIPTTKNLNSAPELPKTEDKLVDEVVRETVSVDEDGNIQAAETVETDEPEEDEGVDDKLDDEDKTNEEESNDKDAPGKEKPRGKNKQKVQKTFKNPFVNWLYAHKKAIIISAILAIILTIVLVWALVIAPAATVTVGIRTTKSNFSQNVVFTDDLSAENVNEGRFYLQKKEVETAVEINFKATGKKNVGEKATGKLIIYTFFTRADAVEVKAGAIFTINGLSYTADNAAFLNWDGTISHCDNGGDLGSMAGKCLISGEIAVTAIEPGTKYNIAASDSGWTNNSGVRAYSEEAMTGGTDDIITIVQESDIETAKSELLSENRDENTKKLLAIIKDNEFALESSENESLKGVTSTPAVGQEVKKDEEAKLSGTIVSSALVIDKTKVEEYIRTTAKLPESYEIYEMNTPFIESFTKTDSGYIGKLKSSYVSGPRVTENDVIEIIRGKGLGTAQHDLKDIDGISSIRIDTSFPWVLSIPNSPDKITVVLNVEE